MFQILIIKHKALNNIEVEGLSEHNRTLCFFGSENCLVDLTQPLSFGTWWTENLQDQSNIWSLQVGLQEQKRVFPIHLLQTYFPKLLACYMLTGTFLAFKPATGAHNQQPGEEKKAVDSIAKPFPLLDVAVPRLASLGCES